MADSKSCSVCFNDYESTLGKRPKFLTCGHVYCETCLNEIYRVGRMVCPTCRSLHRINPSSISPAYEFLNLITKKEEMKVFCTKISCGKLSVELCGHCGRSLCLAHHNEHTKELQRYAEELLEANKHKAASIIQRNRLFMGSIVSSLSQSHNYKRGLETVRDKLTEKVNTITFLINNTEQKLIDERSLLAQETEQLDMTVRDLTRVLREDSDSSDIWNKCKPLDNLVQDMEARSVQANLSVCQLSLENKNRIEDINQLIDNFNIEEKILWNKNTSLDNSLLDVDIDRVRVIDMGALLPMDIAAVCHNTRGYDYNGRPLPTPCIFVKTKGDHTHLLRYDDSGVSYGATVVKYSNCNIQSICNSDVKQRLFISDSRNHSVHIMTLGGEIEQQLRSPKDFLFPAGITTDERLDRMLLYVCDAQRSEILIFSLNNYILMQTIFDPMLHCDICYPSINTVWDQLYITNLESNNILVFSLPNLTFLKTIPEENDSDELFYPWGLAHDSSGRCFVSSFHKIVEISDTGKILRSIGHEGQSLDGFKCPMGLKIINGTFHKKLIICDTDNNRLKFYNLF